MENEIRKFYFRFIAIAASYIKDSVTRYLPSSAQKDFMLWMLDDKNPLQENYLRMMGVAGSIELELALLGKVVDQSKLHGLGHAIGLLNAYFAFETLSDNIGVGLSSSSRSHNITYEEQKIILAVFNTAMIKKLNGDTQTTIELLEPCKVLTKKVSLYEKSLIPEQMHQFSDEYERHHHGATLAELEYSFFEILVLNIETCINLLNFLKNHVLYDFLKESLIARYSSVNALIKPLGSYSLPVLADLGAKSILVIPTLAYCIGALDVTSPCSHLEKSIQNQSLLESLYSASLMVRLLNDIGTKLLILTKDALRKFYEELKLLEKQQKFNSIFDLLKTASQIKELFYLMTRIRKDITQGEFNVTLDNLSENDNISNGLREFFDRIVFYSTLYQEHGIKLKDSSDKLSATLGTTSVSDIINNFVNFHKVMYSKEFETKYGDYATTKLSAER